MAFAPRENQGPEAQNGGDPETNENGLFLCTLNQRVTDSKNDIKAATNLIWKLWQFAFLNPFSNPPFAGKRLQTSRRHMPNPISGHFRPCWKRI